MIIQLVTCSRSVYEVFTPPPPLLIYVAFPLRRAVEAGLALKPRQTAFVAYRLPMFVGRAHRDIRGVRVAR